MKQIAAAFVKAQKAFGPALKTNTNPHFKSKYADLSACVEAVIDALHSNGIALVQATHPDETGVTVETILLHESGEQLTAGRLHVPAAKQDPQGYGSALTYARRYSLMAACGIAPEDDDGNAAARDSALEQQLRASIELAKASKESHSPALLAWNSLQPEIQTAFRKAAAHVEQAMPDCAKAIDLIEMALDNWPNEGRQELKAGFWWLLDSKTRSAIKRHTQISALTKETV